MAKMSGSIERQLAGENPRLTVDLAKMFNVDKFPKSDSLREQIGQAIIDEIEKQTLDGNFLTESAGAQKYSNQYVESYEFQVYNKKKTEVNLKASGDMLGSMQLEMAKNINQIKITFSDAENAAKAHGHITGSVGKKRDFFGLDDKEIKSIVAEFEDKVIDAIGYEMAGESLKTKDPNQSDIDFIRELLDASEN